MPRIELIPEVTYGPNDPIHWQIDNLPLKNIIQRQTLINLAVDDLVEQMRDAIGNQGSVANRLNQSINEDGSLKTSAIDEAAHSIEEHTDTDDYVRMTKSQSDKLDLVSDEATDVSLSVKKVGGDVVDLSSGEVKFQPSDTITLDIESPNVVKWNMKFPTSAAHRHYYDIEPVHSNLTSPDYVNYKVNSSATKYIEGSLRVFVNGVRLSSTEEVYVPGHLVDDPWTLLKFTPDHESGTFALSAAISDEDFIMVDFDVALT